MFALATVFNGFSYFLENMSCSQFLTGSCEKKFLLLAPHPTRIQPREKTGEKGKFALASGEDAHNREKAREVYCPQDY